MELQCDATIALVGASYETVNAQAEQGAAYGFLLSGNAVYLPLVVR